MPKTRNQNTLNKIKERRSSEKGQLEILAYKYQQAFLLEKLVHYHIMEEIQALGKANIKKYNRGK